MFEKKLFLQFDCFHFFPSNIKSLYVSYLPLIYIDFCLLFQKSDLKLTLHCHCNRCCFVLKWQISIIVCFVCCIDTLIRLRHYIYSIQLFILSTIFSDKISTGFVSITAKKVSLFSVSERKLVLWLYCLFFWFK